MRLTAEDNRPRSGGMGMRASQIFIQPISSSTRTAAAAAFAANAAPKEKVGFHANGGLEQQITNEPKFLRCGAQISLRCHNCSGTANSPHSWLSLIAKIATKRSE
jgi:hypothetical protein